jgi:hypothetical protein
MPDNNPNGGTQPSATNHDDVAKKFGLAGVACLIISLLLGVVILTAFFWGPIRFAGIKLHEADRSQQSHETKNTP